MKRFAKIMVLSGMLALTLIVGVGIGLGLGISRSETRLITRIDPIVGIERPFVEEIVIEDVQEEIFRADELADEAIRGSERGRMIMGDAPMLTLPDIPARPALPAAVAFNHGFNFLRWLGSFINAMAAAALILIGVWLIVRRNRPPVEKSPDV